MEPWARLRALASDPPLRDRLLWRGLLHPAARDQGERALEASAFGAIFGLGGLTALLSLLLGEDLVALEPQMTAAGLLALGIGVVCLLGYRRLPRAFFHAAAVAGVAVVTLAADSTAMGASAVFAPFYAFVGMLGLLFFRPLPALGGSALAIGAYGVLLYARDTPFAPQLLLSSIAMLSALGVLILVIRSRTSQVAGELSADADTDALTGAPNRRSFDERLDLEVERARRQGTDLSLMICDLDRFKRVNDDFGHNAGDDVLRRAARAIAAQVRAVDLAARIGGEEFGLILPGAASREALVAAERVRAGIAEEFEGEEPAVTASCGLTSADGQAADGRSLFAEADRALYRAKRAGRNCTALADGDQMRIIGGSSPIQRLRQTLGG